MTNHETQFTPHPIPDGIVEVHGNKYMADAKGRLTALEMIKPQRKLEDELVRREFGFALALADQIARFKGHAYTNMADFDAVLAQEYNIIKGGSKGNKQYVSFDGLMMVEVRVQDHIAFGPEIHVAKAIFDDILTEKSADSAPEVRSIIMDAFATDKAGQINRANLYLLLQTESEDPRWGEGQRAIRDAMRVVGSKSYIRFKIRTDPEGGWDTVTIDLANA